MTDFLRHIFAFNTESPLLFTQFYFWAFFAIVYAIFAIIMDVGKNRNATDGRTRLHMRNIFLMVVSWFFYYKTSGIFLLILLFITTSDWLIAKRIYSKQQLSQTTRAIIWLVLSIIIDLGLLFYFKYAYFFTNVFNNLFGSNFAVFDIFAYIGNGFSNDGRFSVDSIILPVGISFYIFQVISYTVDVFRGHIKPVKNLLDFGFYVSFFPQLVAGPIVRANEFIPQLYRPFRLSRRMAGLAIFWILNGLIKKIILSDYLAVNLIDRVFENPLLFSGFENLFALFAYSLQVYADFSGYTDIAIGLALLMGFYLPQNFDSPYKSTNPQEFWRRWHMSLSRWLKSYLYIPLGGNRKVLGIEVKNKVTAGNINSFATMLLGGLWHGASWNFVIWGALNGIGMVVYKIWDKMNWHLKYALITLITIGITTAAFVHHIPVINLLFDKISPLINLFIVRINPLLNLLLVCIVAIWIGSTIRYIYYLITSKIVTPSKTINIIATAIGSCWAILQTFVFITFTRLFFRSGSNLDPETANQEAWETAKNMVNQIGGAWNSSIIPDFLWEYRSVVILFVLGMVIHWLPARFKCWYRLRFAMLPMWLIVLLTALTVVVVYQFVTADMQAFIYFQF